MRGTLALAGVIVVLSVGPADQVSAADAGTTGSGMKGAASVHAEGSFEVKIAPQADDAGTGLGRMSIQKTWHGEV